jgi:hypothetical protein
MYSLPVFGQCGVYLHMYRGKKKKAYFCGDHLRLLGNSLHKWLTYQELGGKAPPDVIF